MAKSLVRVVLRKELCETFRDRRTVFSVIISPLLITPLLLSMVGMLVTRQARAEQHEVLTVGLVGGEQAPTLRRLLSNSRGLRFEAVSAADAHRRVRTHDLRAALQVPRNADSLLAGHRRVPLKVLVDPGNEASQRTAQRVHAFFEERSKRVVAQRLSEKGLSSELVSPFDVRDTRISGGGSVAGLMLAMFLPYVLVLSSILGGVYAANDLVAGEKERGTLEALLVSPASRRDLVMGKFLTVAIVSLVSSLLSVVGLVLPFWLQPPGMSWLARTELTLTPLALAAMLLVQFPIAILGAGLLLTVSTYARNQKEAQSYLSPVMLIVTVVAMLSLILKAEAPLPLALAPILNAALALKQALNGSLDPTFALLAVGASIVYASLAMAFATRLFQQESVLLKA